MSKVSQMSKVLDAQVEAFRNRPLDASPSSFIWMDALTQKVREGGRTVNVHVLVATGVNADGHREILGVEVTSSEDGAGWLAFLRGLVARGLSGVQLVRRAPWPGRGGRSDAARRGLATLSAPLPAEPFDEGAQVRPAMGRHAGADHLRPAGRRRALCLARPRRRQLGGQASRCRRSPGRGQGRARLPARDLATDLVQQPPRTTEQGDPPPHGRGRKLPDRGAIIRLVGAVLMEQTDERTEARRYMGLEFLAKAHLRIIAGDPPNENTTTQAITCGKLYRRYPLRRGPAIRSPGPQSRVGIVSCVVVTSPTGPWWM